MSGTLNKVMLIGHLGDDVKMHYFDGGGAIGRFPLPRMNLMLIKQVEKELQIPNGTTLL